MTSVIVIVLLKRRRTYYWSEHVNLRPRQTGIEIETHSLIRVLAFWFDDRWAVLSSTAKTSCSRLGRLPSKDCTGLNGTLPVGWFEANPTLLSLFCCAPHKNIIVCSSHQRCGLCRTLECDVVQQLLWQSLWRSLSWCTPQPKWSWFNY